MATSELTSTDNTSLYRQLDRYDWAADPEFQGGLSAILGAVQDPHQVEHLTLRAKCYYYARKAGTPVDFDGYKSWVEAGARVDISAAVNGHSRPGNGGGGEGGEAEGGGRGKGGRGGEEEDEEEEEEEEEEEAAAAGGAGGMGDAPKPASFADICDMIAEGKPIPGIKDIPDTILEGHASETQAEMRKKPWEKAAAAVEETPSWMT